MNDEILKKLNKSFPTDDTFLENLALNGMDELDWYENLNLYNYIVTANGGYIAVGSIGYPGEGSQSVILVFDNEFNVINSKNFPELHELDGKKYYTGQGSPVPGTAHIYSELRNISTDDGDNMSCIGKWGMYDEDYDYLLIITFDKDFTNQRISKYDSYSLITKCLWEQSGVEYGKLIMRLNLKK